MGFLPILPTLLCISLPLILCAKTTPPLFWFLIASHWPRPLHFRPPHHCTAHLGHMGLLFLLVIPCRSLSHLKHFLMETFSAPRKDYSLASTLIELHFFPSWYLPQFWNDAHYLKSFGYQCLVNKPMRMGTLLFYKGCCDKVLQNEWLKQQECLSHSFGG